METELRFQQHRFFVLFPLKYHLLFLNGVGCLNLDYRHKHSDKRFLLLGHVISCHLSSLTYQQHLLSWSTWNIRCFCRHPNVESRDMQHKCLQLNPCRRGKVQTSYKCSPVFMPESFSPFAQWSTTGVPSLPGKDPWGQQDFSLLRLWSYTLFEIPIHTGENSMYRSTTAQS